MSKVLRRIPKVFKKGWNRPDKNLKYLDASFDDGRPFFGGYIENTEYGDVDDDGDTWSISTVSTNATMDNNPGTGRIIDICIYQFLGRKIERFANRISISLLSPAEIYRSLRYVARLIGVPGEPRTLSWAIDRISCWPLDDIHPGACLAGLKSLVRQSQ